MDKLVLLCVFYGGLRSSELASLKWEDVVFAQEGIFINIAVSKTDRAGVVAVKFLPKIEKEKVCLNFYFNRYKEAVKSTEDLLFLHFRNQKFINQRLGRMRFLLYSAR